MGMLFCLIAIALFVPTSLPAVDSSSLRELYVSTSPPSATVYIDGKSRGRTPVTVMLSDSKPHLLDIKKNGYNNVRQTVILNNGQKLPLDIQLESILGLALIKTTPPGASVRINDIDRGKTPLLVTDLPIGIYHVSIAAPGFIKKDLELVLNDRIPVEINEQLVSDSARVNITSIPAGASVIINGAVHGVTPCELPRIPEGNCSIIVRLDGYMEYNRQIKLVAGKSEKLDITLNPLPASLQISSTPADAKVYINEKYKGITPLLLRNMIPGEYQVRLELKGHDIINKTIELNRGDKSMEDFQLVPNTGALEVTSEPSNIKVFIDGKWSGLTTAKPDRTDKVSEVLILDGIPSGSHEIKFTAKGYYAKEITIDVDRGRTVVHHVSLKRRFIPDCEIRTATEVYQGVLVQIDPAGNVKLEVNPGVMKIVMAADIISRKPLRVDVEE